MSTHALDISAANFQREVIDASRAVPVLVDFWAPWCGPCRVLKPVLEKLADQYQGRFRLAKVNSDDNPQLSAQYGVRSIPNVKAFVDGELVDEFLGAQSESAVRAFIDGLMPSPGEILRRQAAARSAAGDAAGALGLLEQAAEAGHDDAVRWRETIPACAHSSPGCASPTTGSRTLRRCVRASRPNQPIWRRGCGSRDSMSPASATSPP